MDDLKLIKKHYGEKMSHLCRDLFPTLLETPGLLYETLTSKYYPSRFLYDDIVNNSFQYYFKNIIYKATYQQKEEKKKSFKIPFELMKEAGYTLYECKTEEDIQSFRHYYKRNDNKTIKYIPGSIPTPYNGEELCTFNGGRLERNYVFFAVKNNADKLKREDFLFPQRQDEYGVSVISIQFTRGSNNLVSIKNRYNHTVPNPDSTFGNNLDNIIPGLTDSFEKYYGYNINSGEFIRELPNYVLANDGRYYKYNFEKDNIYYCPDNVVIDNFEVKKFDKSRYIVMDNYIIDMQEKTIMSYREYQESLIPKEESEEEPEKETISAFTEIFRDVEGKSEISKIVVEVDKETNTKKVIIDVEKTFDKDTEYEKKETYEGITIELNPTNTIKGYRNDYLTMVGDNFLDLSQYVEYIDLPKVEKIGEFFLYYNRILKRINISKCKSIGIAFLFENRVLEELNLPNVEDIHTSFMYHNKSIREIYFPKCVNIGAHFLYNNSYIRKVILPNVEVIGDSFLDSCVELDEIYLPSCRRIGKGFLKRENNLESIDLPEVEEIDEEFMKDTRRLKYINMSKCKSIGNYFLYKNRVIESIDLPSIISIGSEFLEHNCVLKSILAPKCEKIGNYFLRNNRDLKKIELPNVIEIGNDFLYEDRRLSSIDISRCKKIGSNFLANNRDLEIIDLSSVESVEGFPIMYMVDLLLSNNIKVKKILNKGAEINAKGKGSRKR